MTRNLIRIGELEVDPVDFAIHGNAILGIKESGKTYSATFFAERLMDANIPILAIDPIGVWRFLRVAGTGPGYPVVVAGGEHGDLPLSPENAADIVRAAMREGISLVLDLYSITLSKADWRRIVIAALDVLLHENRVLRHIFVEEAAEFVPQRVGASQGHVYAAMEKLARMGGNVRLGYTLINQRAEEVNKAVLELCDTLFLHRQKGRHSITALQKWLDVAGAQGVKEIIPSLPLLGKGECWAWLSGTDTPVKVHIPRKRTQHPDRRALDSFDPSVIAVGLGPVDVTGFVSKLKAALEQKPKEEPPVAARAHITTSAERASQVATLKAELAAEYQRGYAEGRDIGYRNGFEDGRKDGFGDGARAMAGTLEQLVEHGEAWITLAKAALEGAKSAVPPPRDPLLPPLVAPAAYSAPAPRPARAKPDDGSIHAAARAMLAALAQNAPGRFTWQQTATLAGLKARGGHFNAGRKDLLDRGLITEEGGLIAASKKGLKEAGTVPPKPATPSEIVDMWCARLPAPAPEMLRYVVQQGGRPVTREELATALGKQPHGGHWNGGLANLRNNGLVEAAGNALRPAALLLGSKG